jgi:hypothetical protein
VHTIKTEITFVPGVSISGNIVRGNDFVKVYVNGALDWTGSTWEAYYYAAAGPDVSNIQRPRLQAVNALMFCLSLPYGGAIANQGKGLLFQEVLVGNSRT